MKYTINNSIRNALCIVLLSILLSVAHAEEGIEATVGDLTPTPTGTILIDGAAEGLSKTLGEGSEMAKNGRMALDQCALEFEAGNKDNTAHVKYRECIIESYSNIKNGFQHTANGLEEFSNHLAENYKMLGMDLQQVRDEIEAAEQIKSEHEVELKQIKIRVAAIAGKLPQGEERISDTALRRELRKLRGDYKKISTIKATREREAENLANHAKRYDKLMSNVIAWREVVEDEAYSLNRGAETIEVIAESAVRIGIANARVLKWSGSDAALSKLDINMQKLAPIIGNVFNDLKNFELPLLDLDDDATASPTTGSTDMDEKSLIEWAKSISEEERGE